MNPLSLDRINAKAPYQVSVSAEKGYFDFDTWQGVSYSVSLTEEFELGGCMSYQIGVRNANNKHGSFDPKIRETIIAILEEFFRSNQNVLLYVCDTSDQREEARNRLFIKWFRDFAVPEQYSFCSADTVVEGEGFYTAIIVENTNPHLEAIKQDYAMMAEKLSK